MIKKFWDYCFNFSGRMSRIELLIFPFLLILISYGLLLAGMAALSILAACTGDFEKLFHVWNGTADIRSLSIVMSMAVFAGYAFLFLFAILSAIANISFSVRRLHDLNLSGTWLLAWSAFIVILFFCAAFSDSIVWVIIGMTLLIPVLLLIPCLYFIPGTKGENRYGKEPHTITFNFD